jgi:aryl carrier-like protein
VLRRHPAVRDCVVVVREDEPGDPRLVAYAAADGDVDTLRAHVRASLPGHMVPSAFVLLDALPLTPNGKLDRKALPEPGYTPAAASLPPRNQLERRVAEAWKEVLRVAEVGVSDNFFDLGGSSLLLSRVFSRVRELRADLRMVDLFRYPTVEALAGYLGAEETGAASELADSRSRAEERRNSRRRARSG